MEKMENLDNPVESGVVTSSQPESSVSDHSSESSTAENEKTVSLTQSRIDSLIKSGYKKGYERSLKDNSNVSDESSQPSSEEVLERARQEAKQTAQATFERNLQEYQKRVEDQERKSAEEQSRRIVENTEKSLVEKIEKDKEKHPHLFEKDASHINIGDKYPLIEALNEIDNPLDVLNELDKNPALYNKWAQTSQFVEKNPNERGAFHAEIKQIATKLQNDEKASRIHNFDSPSSPVKTTHHGRGATSSSHEDKLRDKRYMW